ncbi:MAG TPA: MAPEG family protein [Cellvibrionaceae bacterium]|nr:MAPEG family protein [Cellvibrionaceae bacterium]HMW70298.1 MAPEG family protein [Cellvibrionaceae bacterium]HNG58355.1 MAPEG family protein [Cellvibrionaceae bacterium]
MLYPLYAQVVLTFLVLFWAFFTRIQAVRQREINFGYFRLMQGAAPERMQKATRQFANLFEMPVLFYAVCLLCVFKGFADTAQVALAWIYVVCRSAQALIHLSYNHILHRVVVFGLGNAVLLALWLRVMLHV